MDSRVIRYDDYRDDTGTVYRPLAGFANRSFTVGYRTALIRDRAIINREAPCAPLRHSPPGTRGDERRRFDYRASRAASRSQS